MDIDEIIRMALLDAKQEILQTVKNEMNVKLSKEKLLRSQLQDQIDWLESQNLAKTKEITELRDTMEQQRLQIEKQIKHVADNSISKVVALEQKIKMRMPELQSKINSISFILVIIKQYYQSTVNNCFNMGLVFYKFAICMLRKPNYLFDSLK